MPSYRPHLRLALLAVSLGLLATLVSARGAQGQTQNLPVSIGAAEAAVAQGTAFGYQGELRRAGALINGTCNLRFSLWDALAGGLQLGSLQTVNSLAIANGRFSVQLDFGNQFTGDARWLQVAVQCAGDGGFTTLAPRQPLLATPYAHSLRPGAQINAALPSGGARDALLKVTNSSGTYPIGLIGNALAPSGPAIGVEGVVVSPLGFGVYGGALNGGMGVRGQADSGIGTSGVSQTGHGVDGYSVHSVGVVGESLHNDAIAGIAHADGYSGVVGRGIPICPNDICLVPVVVNGVYGESLDAGAGVKGVSAGGDGVLGWSNAQSRAGVAGVSTTSTGWGVYGRNDAGGYAGYFVGRTRTGVLEIAGGSDLAERFDVSDAAPPEPGTLMIIDADNPGHLTTSTSAYDTKVAGVVSGAGGVETGLTLHQEGVLEGDTVVAIAGRVYVNAEAFSGPIRPGDLLTTSDLPGHAMAATDRDRAQGAVIGKAMTGLDSGTGLVLVLVNLQ